MSSRPQSAPPPRSSPDLRAKRSTHNCRSRASTRDARIAQNARPITRAARTTSASLMYRWRTGPTLPDAAPVPHGVVLAADVLEKALTGKDEY